MTFTFSSGTATDGVVEHKFSLDDVPGVLWTPEHASAGAPLLLVGHGGGLHKRAPGLVARARAHVTNDGFRVAAIDAPGHGDRPRSEQDQRWIDAMLADRAAGRPIAPVVAEYNQSLAERAVPEWQAVIEALLERPEIGADAPLGYSGMTLASTIGIPLVAAERRIRAAVFGGVFAYEALLASARRLTVPVEYLLPWDDDELDRESGFAVFDAFGSEDKTLHAFPGSHFRVPAERIDTRFFARHLTR